MSENEKSLWESYSSPLGDRKVSVCRTINRMFPRMLLGFLWGVSALAAKNDSAQHSQPPLLLVSFDGFRADYLQRFPMPNLKLLYSQGVLVDQLTNVFITKTFPNHYSLVTGLYAESHGILASSMYDPISHKHFSIRNDSDPMWWSAAQPLWLTALDSGYKTAAVMWPGSDVTNRTPTHYFPYNSDMTFQQRLGNVTNWILGDEKEPGVMFAALYWEEPDRSGHLFGPENTTAMTKVLKEVDDNIGLLMYELKRTGLWGHINLIVTSDHGMAQCSADRLIRLDDCLHPDNYTLVDLTPVAALIPKEDTESVFSLLSKCHPHMTAYTKKSIPDRLHYRNHVRVQPIILIADEGWTIVKRGNKLPRLDMIDDRMTPLDPVEEFMSVCQQRETSALSPRPASHGVRVVEKGCSKSCAFIWPVTSQEVRSYPVSWLCRK
ncbi:Bis(5'-adenosyl)-triphosphatase enpp4 [Ameca splendens]|uniref:bis(5'-adenosyl)-triphosphatase n=1 Tax=Ameca splendens TaxID=208324 RepID=A0ABV0YDC7_9TELE